MFSRRRRAVLITLLSLAVLTGAASRLWQFGVSSPFTDPLDFRAFYCAGAAVVQHADPYRLEPDRSCQRDVLAQAGLTFDQNFVLPAPLPPYALQAFSVLARLPFRYAAALWMALNILALLASIALLGKLSGTRPAVAALALFLPLGFVCLTLGQLVPLVVAAILFAAFHARRGNGAGIATGAAIAAIEPHLALPLWLALALFVPAARKPLAVTAAALGALTLLPGPSLNIEYVRMVIPQHARAELTNFEIQYGLSSLLAALDVAPDIALRVGTASYAVMLAFGLTLGKLLQRRYDDAAFCVLAPLSAVVLGGPFLHIQQMVVAIPFGLMLVARLPRFSLAFASGVFAIVLLAVPWPLWDAFVTPSAALTRTANPRPSTYVHEATSDESIESAYEDFTVRFERRPNKHSLRILISRKLPTWFALIALLAIASSLAYRTDRLRHDAGVNDSPALA